MADGSRRSDTLLIAGFVAILFGVPLGQTAVEVRRGGRVQVTDLFRYAPSQRNLRRFEEAMEEASWHRRALRGPVQRLLLAALGDVGAKGVKGRGGWLFYRPGVRYLVEPAAGAGRREHVVRAIVAFRDQLAGRGIRLLVVPVPGKASIYPDMLTARAAAGPSAVRSPTLDVLAELAGRGVATADLFAEFARARRERPDVPLYLARDTHWRPAGARLAAEAVARRLRGLGWAPAPKRPYETRRVRVRRHGDILAMMRLPGIEGRLGGEAVACEQVLDPAAGLMVPGAGGRSGTYASEHLTDTPLESSVLLLGDSFCRIYQTPEPRSLGEVVGALPVSAPAARPGRRRQATRRLVPGSAGLPSLLARALRAPVDYVLSDGGAATAVRQKLNTDPAILDNKRVVVWEFAERDIRLGAAGWQYVPLPPPRGGSDGEIGRP